MPAMCAVRQVRRALAVEPKIEIVLNASSAARNAPYPQSLDALLGPDAFAAASNEIATWPGYAPTPLRRLPGLAANLGFADITYKDEAGRFGLGSFKALGGAYAVLRCLATELRRRGIAAAVSAADLTAGRYREIVSAITVTSATDGNHGRSVAWGARLFGCRAVIFIHANVSAGRGHAIEAYGAEVVRVAGNYDDSVRHAFRTALANGWFVVQDTATEGYREIPADITCGYGVIGSEIIDQIETPPTHVVVQAGVGGVASAICARFWQGWGPDRPKFIVLEPSNASCVAASLACGRRTTLSGNVETMMAGLACGEVSELAWEVLATGADGAVVIDDEWAAIGMRRAAEPLGTDPPIVAGECSGGAVGALMALAARPDLARRIELDPSSRILLIGTEGATDPDIYRAIVGRPPEEVAGGPAGLHHRGG
jgi:diaminopropionate ammonia-lyase